MPWIKAAHGLLAGRRRVGGLALSLAALAPAPASAETLRFPLTCTFRTIGVGQFHGLDYAPGPIGSLSTVAITAAPADLRVGRAAVVEGSRVQVADVSFLPGQATFSSQSSQPTMLLAVFTATTTSERLPATYFRIELIGNIPVTVLSTGSCQPAP